jgi:transposase-like protein
MNLIEISKRYNTKEKCVEFLEKKKWGNTPVSPFTGSNNVTKRKNSIYWHCNDTNKDFTVLKDTIFEASKLPLPKWFMLIAIMLNAKKGVSSAELSRQLGITYKSAWYSAMRVRCAMVDDEGLLEGIVEMDETYIGGRPRKRGVKVDSNVANLSTVTTEKPKRGRGTSKIPVVGIVEREGKKRVVTKVMDSLTSRDMLAMLKKYVATDKAIMMTDEYRGYKRFEEYLQHLTVNHSKKQYADGVIHTNTIEGFWSIVKNGIKGEYQVLSKKYLPFYMVEFAYKYNNRSLKSTFDKTIDNALTDEKCVVKYKPKKNVIRTVNPKRKVKQ